MPRSLRGPLSICLDGVDDADSCLCRCRLSVAAGSQAVRGSVKRPYQTYLNIPGTVAKLQASAEVMAPGTTLLRIYWYDGVPAGGVSGVQSRIADTDDVKLRFGTVSASGQQKGVDSLIVTDLVELARNRAISDAVLLSGDEDVRIGVEIAQGFGVRVHLIGIEPTRGNQSRSLKQEADTTCEWSKGEIGELLTVTARPDVPIAEACREDTDESPSDSKTILDDVVGRVVESLEPDRVSAMADLGDHDSIPDDVDRLLLVWSRDGLSRNLDRSEMQYVRTQFRTAVRALT